MRRARRGAKLRPFQGAPERPAEIAVLLQEPFEPDPAHTGEGMDVMTNAELIAGLAGPLLIATAAALLVNRETVAGLLTGVLNSPEFIFFSGILTLVAGLAIVRAHNVWAAEWHILVTVIGWLCIIGGALRVIWPDRVAALRSRMMKSENAVTAWALVALVLGAFLTAKGYALV